jgi:hypothetical protein
MSNIPKEWQFEPHYQPSLYWFSREPQTRRYRGRELTPEELEGYPGWYFHQMSGRNSMRIVDTVDEALGELKSRIKQWKLEGPLGYPAPYQASKNEIRQMLVELFEAPIQNPPADYNPDRDDPLRLMELQWELGVYLLVASIEYTPFRPEFDTVFCAANNPIRSVVGRVCTLRAATQADLEYELDDEDFEAEWKEVAVGTVGLDDDRLTVGFWSHTFDPLTHVVGVAFEEANFEDEEMIYYLDAGVKR